jgi:hypothetical protein
MAPLAPPTLAADSRHSLATARRGMAFGLEIVGRFPAPGLWTGGSLPRRVSLELVAPGSLARTGPGWKLRSHLPLDDAGRKLRLDEHGEHGYLLSADGFGSYLIARDGHRVALAPGPVAAWRWQRLLTAQVLPIASLAQGLELFHASAVEVDGRAVAIAGGSGAGKTTLAVRLMLSGAGFVSDDVLAVEGAASGLVAHSGPPLMNLRDSAAGLLGPGERSRLGTELGSDEGGPRLLVRRSAAALPLGAVCILRRSTGRQGGVRVTRLSPPRPDMLLGAGFGTTIRTPDRLIRRLDLCARLADSTPVFMIESPDDAPPRTVAGATLRAVRSNP